MRRPTSVEEVIERGRMIGVLEPDCRDWYRDCEACGWLRGDGTPFDNWPRQLVLHRDRMAEKRAKGGPGSLNGKPASIQDIRTVIQFKEEKAKAIKEKYSTDGPVSTDWCDQAKKNEYYAIRKEIRELKSRAERMI